MPKAAAGKETKRKAKPARKSDKKVKRALSAYMFFSQDWRERIKGENPDAGFGEIGKLLGAKWKELSDEDKKPYVEMAATDKIRAEKEKDQVEEKPKEATPAPVDDDDEE